MPDHQEPGFYEWDASDPGITATIDQRRAEARDAVISSNCVILTYANGEGVTHWGHVEAEPDVARSFILYSVKRVLEDFRIAFDIKTREELIENVAAVLIASDLVDIIEGANDRHQDEDLEGEFND